MKSFYVPPIVVMDSAGNSVLITFDDEETISLPAVLLNAAKGIAKAIGREEQTKKESVAATDRIR